MKIIEFTKKIFFFLKKKISIYGIIALVLIIAGLLFFGNKKTTEQTQVIKVGDFVQEVSISGKVIASQDVDLSFKNGGKIKNINYTVGQKVLSGAIIAQIDAKDAQKNLRDAETNLQVAKIALKRAQTESDNTDVNQKTAVADAYKTLLNSYPDAVPSNSSNVNTGVNLTAPIISGNYILGKEGIIKIRFYSSNGGLSFDASGLTNGSSISSTSFAAPIGNSGLYLTLPADNNFSSVPDWVIEIPNKKASNYLNNYNAYQLALEAQKQTSSNSEVNQLNIQTRELAVTQAENAVQDAKNKLEDYYIRAPFEGLITKIDAKLGEIASPDMPLITMMSAGTFQIESYVPEISISKIKIGDPAKITLDAYGVDVFFDASLVSIDPADTLKDGVSTYRVKLQFTDKDERIKSGMTANVAITVFNKPNAIVIPGGIVFEKVGKKFVQVKENGKNIDREITIGETSALGQVEVLSGLKDGDVVILNPVIK